MTTVTVVCPNEACEATLVATVTHEPGERYAGQRTPEWGPEWDADVPDTCPHCLTTFTREEQAALAASAIARAQDEEAGARDYADEMRFQEWHERRRSA